MSVDTTTPGASGESAPSLSEFILQNIPELVSRWEERIRPLPVARQLSSVALRDHIPQLLELIAHSVSDHSVRVSLGDLPDVHAIQRLSTGFDLQTAAEELAELRAVLFESWLSRGRPPSAREIMRLNRAIDDTIGQSVGRFAKSRERTLVALDRVSSAALGTGDLEVFMPRLLQVVLETTEAADMVSLCLVEKGMLRLAASRGLEEEIGTEQPIGVGFAGGVAASRVPALVRDASTDPSVLSPGMKTHKIHALYGVPLIHDDKVIGVAKMGSRTAYDFSDDDKQLFRAMAQRATSLIVQAQLVAAMRDTVELLEERTEFEEQLVGIVSHDLRNPLHAILMSTGVLLQREELDARTTKAIARIQSSAHRANRLIRDLLDFTRARLSGGIPVQHCQVELHAIARMVADEVHLIYPDRRLLVEQSGDGRGEWDGDRLAQIIANLLTNAMKYSPPQSSVTLRSRGDGAHAYVDVHNDGPPIPSEQMPTLFHPMKRGPDLSRDGLGLGLFIVDQLVKAHGGEVSVASSTETGTTFTVKLPRRAPPPSS